MSFFDDDEDPFEDIVKQFFGQRSPRTSSSGNVVRGEKEERVIDYIEEDDSVYLVFEMPGYSREDINIEIKGREIEISAIKEKPGNIQQYLADKMNKGIFFRRTLPSGIKLKNYEETFRNGVLELKFRRR
jgi:HSP20 family protein